MKLLKQLVRTRQKGLRELREVAGYYDITSAPYGHLACPGCGTPWFEVSGEGAVTYLGCKKCHFQAKMLMPNRFDQEGTIRCPKHGTSMAIIKTPEVICCGCQKCDWQLISSLTPKNESGLIV